MRESLSVLLLGSPRLAAGGTPLGVRSAKARALLCYLATAQAPRPRAELATLLWGERPDANARGSLRLALSELRREVGDWLDVTREHVCFPAAEGCFVDRHQLAGAPPVAEVLRLWRGDFMDGVSFCDAPAFGDWLAAERSRVRLLLREVLLRSATSSPCAQVARLASVVTGLDPYDEEAYRVLMTALARAGNRAAALARYDELRQRLTTDLGVDPAPETQALRRELTGPGLVPEPRRARGLPSAKRRPGALPVPSTELIGREADVRRLCALLDRERLVVLLGPGGIGKTRLAIAAAHCREPTEEGRAEAARGEAARGEAARGEAARGEAGRGEAARGEAGRGEAGRATAGRVEAVFVGFAGVRGEAAVTTLARRLGVDLSPSRPALDLLLAALSGRSRPLLLVLDNLEQLPAFDAVIGRILEAAPAVRVLVTSRRRPELPGQKAITVRELAAEAAEALFAARARAAQPAFDPEREAAPVAAICAATGGLPLAIELAAGLLRAVPGAELARLLGADLGLLSVAGPAARPRHACMRTVFETSWRLLDQEGQAALAALSVFGGGCTLEAAVEVATTTPDVLVRLVDHSMLQLTPSGRYAVHPLIRQYAAAHLTPAERRAARRRHAAYFGRLLETHATALQDAADTEGTRLLAPELDNVRAAWATSGRPRFLELYWTLCLRLHLYEESAAVVRRHLAGTDEEPRLRARHLWMAGTSEHHLAREREATCLARTALATLGEPLPESRAGLLIATATAALPATLSAALPAALPATARRLLPGGRSHGAEAAQALTMLARLAYHQQDVLTMLAASLRQLKAADRSGDAALRAEAYANAATIARLAGLRRTADRYGTMADHALAAVTHPAEPAHRAHLARGIDQLHAGSFEAARRSFTTCRAGTLAPRVAENCAGMLAETALWQGRFEEAADLFAATAEQAATRVGDDIGRHWCLMGRAEALLRLHDLPTAPISDVLAAARASHDRRRTHAEELGLHDGPTMTTIQEMRLLTATARLTGEPERRVVGEVVGEALGMAERLPSAQRGMLECWAGLAELLWAMDPWPDPAVARRLHRHLVRFVRRNPGAAARVGWARALVLAVAGRRGAARRAAEEAVRVATRLDVPYDRVRAEAVVACLTYPGSMKVSSLRQR
ncbi:BTAD domain-containing putative transcriptional regulator [Nonomuraea sp. NPDC049421]|uniref:ATP-binding protein n=1 Tax=Nonomuraea sp. NPDC049421 TaxID=3155275 RepID=UPI0034223B69